MDPLYTRKPQSPQKLLHRYKSIIGDGLRALRPGDVLVFWKLDRLGRTLAHLVTTVQDLSTPRMWYVSSCNRGAK